MKRSRRSLAALKGWETRRAHARDRSLAAKRGWETRQKNERRERALKGWRTRKRKEAALERRIQAAELEEPEEFEYAITYEYKGKK